LRDYPDLFKFSFFEAEEFRHLDDLIRIYEIRRLSAESIHTWIKLAALHCLRDVQTKAAATLSRVKQAKLANSHFISSATWFAVDNISVLYDCARAALQSISLRMSMDHPPYAITK